MDVEAIKERQKPSGAQGDYAVLSRQLAPRRGGPVRRLRRLGRPGGARRGRRRRQLRARLRARGRRAWWRPTSPRGWSSAAAPARRRRATTSSGWRRTPRRCRSRTPASTAWARSFGAFIAPRPEVVARELFRVVRPGGTVGLTAWTPDGVMAEMFGVGRRYAPLEPDQPPSEPGATRHGARAPRAARRAGRDRAPRARLGGRVAAGVRRGVQRLGADDGGSAEGASAGALRGAERADARDVERNNESGDGSLRIEAEYVVIVARRRG